MTEAQLENIRRMEAVLDRTEDFLHEADAFLLRWQAVLSEAECLSAYYHSPQWVEDVRACDCGEMPADIAHGVLSEDGIYNTLAALHEVAVRLLKQAAGVM